MTAGGGPPVRRTTRKKSLFLRLTIVFAVLLVVGAIGLAVAGVYAAKLVKQEPTWWADADSANTERAPERARLLEQGITTALHEPREGDEPWTVRMTDEDVNAWLEHRLESWAENRSMDVPSGFTAPRVRVIDGRVAVGIASPDPRVPGILTVEFTPEFSSAGELVAGNRSFTMGRLPLPNPEMLGRLSNTIKQQARGTPMQDVFDALLESGKSLPSNLTLSDQRRVSLRGLSLREDGSIDLTLATAREQ